MLIVKNFHDYYDSAIGLGIDKTIVYERKQSELKSEILDDYLFKAASFIPRENHYYIDSDKPLVLGVIGFCGKFYPFFKGRDNDFITYDFNEAFEYCEKWLRKNKRNIRWPQMESDKLKEHKAASLNAFEYIKKYENIDIFREWKTPVFSAYRQYRNTKENNVLLNPKLKDYDFGKIKEAYQCFQNIAMFISSYLIKSDEPPVTISNKDKITAHGFDLKESFRHPVNPRPKKKSKKLK